MLPSGAHSGVCFCRSFGCGFYVERPERYAFNGSTGWECLRLFLFRAGSKKKQAEVFPPALVPQGLQKNMKKKL